ncbi:MAG: tetratricopeptide repeat protein [Ktedonobacteraceae bacterium]|nr:tetratricopeptide repeat protein [Ktedonobacteraceae bacterium]
MFQQQRLPLSLYINQQKELQAALWWRLGESHESTDDRKALTCYETALSSLPQEQDLKVAIAETCCRLARKSWTEKKYTECLNFANKALTFQPDYDWAYIARGNAFADLQEYARAIDDYTEALRLSPEYAVAYNNRGIAFAGLQEYARAIDDYTEALRLSPEDAVAYNNRGLAFYYNSQWQQAIDDLSVALTLNPDYTAYLERGYSYLHLKRKELALADFITGTEKDPQNVNRAWMALWTSFDKQRPNREVAERLEKIASIDPQQYEASCCKAVASALRGNIKEGLALLEQILQHHPDSQDTHFWYGMLSASYHPYRPQPAITAIEKALEYGMPPILLTPLYWLEKDRPDFFQHYARPLLDRYGM